MKKIILILAFISLKLLTQAQNPLIAFDSLGIHDCDSSQYFLYNETPIQNPPLYYQWIIDGSSFSSGTDQTPFEIWKDNTQSFFVLLSASTNPNYSNIIYSDSFWVYPPACNINIVSTLDNSISCSSELRTFAISGLNFNPTTYIWQHYDYMSGTTTTYTSPTPQFIVNNYDVVSVSVSDNMGNFNQATLDITINGYLPSTFFTYTVLNYDCSTNTSTVAFLANQPGPNNTFIWSFDSQSGLQNSTIPNPIMTFIGSSYLFVTLQEISPTGCIGDYNQTIFLNTNPISMNVYVDDSLSNPCSTACEADAEIFVAGGTAPYQYSLNGVSYGSTNYFTDLCPGVYIAQAQDAFGCMQNYTFIIDSATIDVQEFSYFASCDSQSYLFISTSTSSSVVWSDGYTGAYYPNPLSNTTYGYIVTSPIGCSSSGTIVTPASNNCYTVSGTVYVDLNGDCIFNNNDYTLSSVWVDLTDANGNWVGYYDYTSSTGQYTISAPAGTYYFDVNGYYVNNYATTCPASGFSITIDAANPNPVVDFYMTPPAPSQDLSVTMHNITTFTPGFPFWTMATYCNDGTIPMSGNLVMNYDQNLSYISGSSTSLTSHDAVNHTLTWSFTNLAPGACYTVYPDFTTATTAVLGSIMSNIVVVNPIPGDVTPANNTAYVLDTVVGSWDPNDKAVFPNGDITVNDKDHHYTIRFQNEGTAPAVKVVVRDDLDNNLDIRTLRNVSASHNFVLTVENTDELVFTFDNIMLPAKEDDEEGSQGNIHFSISQNENLPLGTVIENTAGIYFDFNEPVITNTTQNTIVEKTTGIKESKSALLVNIQPNPSNGMFNLQTEANMQSLVVYNMLGKTVFEAKDLAASKAFLNLSHLTKGMYLIKIETDKGNTVEKIQISK